MIMMENVQRLCYFDCLWFCVYVKYMMIYNVNWIELLWWRYLYEIIKLLVCVKVVLDFRKKCKKIFMQVNGLY